MSKRNVLLVLGISMCLIAAIIMGGNFLGERTIPAAITLGIVGIVGIVIIATSRKAAKS